MMDSQITNKKQITETFVIADIKIVNVKLSETRYFFSFKKEYPG